MPSQHTHACHWVAVLLRGLCHCLASSLGDCSVAARMRAQMCLQVSLELIGSGGVTKWDLPQAKGLFEKGGKDRFQARLPDAGVLSQVSRGWSRGGEGGASLPTCF